VTLHRTLLFVALSFALSAQAPNTLTGAEKSAGWTLLFDGKTTAGWLEVTGLPFPTASWTIEDGSLRALNSGHGFQDLRSEVVPRSFEFQFDWKIAKGGNSGVKYLVQKTDRWTNAEGLQARARGLEYQLFDDASDPSADKRKLCGALYDAIAPSRAAARPPGEFNHSLLIVRGGHVEHWLNGEKVVEFETSSPLVHGVILQLAAGGPTVSESFIALQNHGTPVWFRNLKLRKPVPGSNFAAFAKLRAWLGFAPLRSSLLANPCQARISPPLRNFVPGSALPLYALARSQTRARLEFRRPCETSCLARLCPFTL
jgi:hypothetical protein